VDDAKRVGLIVSMILERPTCLRCISFKVEATKLETLLVMRRMAGTLPAEMRIGDPCRVCGSTHDPVYVASRPAA
jgi:hypothetical protein